MVRQSRAICKASVIPLTTSFSLRKERLLTSDEHNIDSYYSVLSVIRGNGGERIARIKEKPR
jgi:hypothetical protein